MWIENENAKWLMFFVVLFGISHTRQHAAAAVSTRRVVKTEGWDPQPECLISWA